MARLLDQILVIDVESTCWEKTPPPGESSEIIEVGLCCVDLRSLERGERRSLLVKPDRSTIGPFCTRLTTLTPEMVADAGDLGDAVEILRREYRAKDRLWASWGDYDRKQFERNCTERGLRYPFGPSHLNVKSLFAAGTGAAHEMGLAAALERLGLPLEGTHHRGDDDAWNIAAVLCHLLRGMRSAGAPPSNPVGGAGSE